MKIRGAILAVLTVGFLVCNGCIVEMYEDYKRDNARKETTSVVETTTFSLPEVKKDTLFGIVTEVDVDNKLITIKNIETSEVVSYSYTGATDVRDKYDNIMAMALMEPGDIVEGEYCVDNNHLNTLGISKNAWENLRVHNWKYSREGNYLRIGNQKYDLYDAKVVVSDGEVIDIRELAEVDELIVRGYENKVYSITVLKGHGYVSLKNDSYFFNGIVTVGNDVGLEITDDMLIMVGEGEHMLSVSKNGVGGSVLINVPRNKEIVVDIGEFQGEVNEYGSISFTITPKDATLYIDGRKKDYSELVELEFGTYTIAVEAEGYVPYIGDLVVSDTFQKKVISLGLEKAENITTGEEETTTGENNTEEETTVEENNSEGNNGEEETTVGEQETIPDDSNIEEGLVDDTTEPTIIYTGEKDVSKYNIYIETPTGAEVYFDSEYIGIAPVKMPKQSGMHTIILKKDGYKTRAYTIEISAEARDEHFSFMSMTE
ncbi:MAG: PEGA domain-containing protein [Lachnospiraceae bacterium]|nr:PEGA domain-containing protein [Lachnospiraceae bacterium]